MSEQTAVEACNHLKVIPVFDEEAAKELSPDEVRKRWPRFDGICPDCNQRLIAYASSMHYYSGDY